MWNDRRTRIFAWPWDVDKEGDDVDDVCSTSTKSMNNLRGLCCVCFSCTVSKGIIFASCKRPLCADDNSPLIGHPLDAPNPTQCSPFRTDKSNTREVLTLSYSVLLAWHTSAWAQRACNARDDTHKNAPFDDWLQATVTWQRQTHICTPRIR